MSNQAKFRSLGLFAKPQDQRLGECLHKLVKVLQPLGVEILYSHNAAAAIGSAEGMAASELSSRIDLAIVLGGDGTFLGAVRELAGCDIPVVGINLGRLGFLVDISPQDVGQVIPDIIRGKYLAEQRFLLEASLDGKTHLALNDVVLHRWNTARMIEFETNINQRFVDSQRSDGIIISTPTGSTAYALSGGGPLLEPSLDAITLVPICPHHLSNRPLVVHGNSEIRIDVCCNAEQVRVTCDGQDVLSLGADKRLLVRKFPTPVRLLHPERHDHFSLLRAKLGWGGHVGGRR